MSIIVDTNILVRAITLDPPAEGRRATEILGSDIVVIPTIAVCEMIWVLRRLYKLTHLELVQATKALLAIESVVLDRGAITAGLIMMEAGGDFADGAIAYEGQGLGGDTFASFDKKAIIVLKGQGQKCVLLEGT
ncbi:type II toxin-antitoxin system VapC family toxin [Rhizobium tubonense]|uniref:VapC toxin family PIN domain ribonuclease n=1 Tax=Rhizobium tubonense TaxID=484088 RepID=A0A2W4CSI1_9HYPH|nr:type II toxin-antitoxin system VapC family toxin [Rhizobium tubonense]PZM13798.1 VapC toxin family PIN domain ribonuclease [Rhizobium tubonense]